MKLDDINIGDRLLVRWDGCITHGTCNWVYSMNKYNGSVVIAHKKHTKGCIQCIDIDGYNRWYYEPEWLTPAVDDMISIVPDNILI